MELKKELGILDVFSITTGTMISAGLFILPGLAHAKTGSSVVFSYFFAGLLAIPGMLSQAELSSAMPKAGGSYYFITRSMGPAIGTVYGLITWFALALKSAFALFGITVFAVLIININKYIIAGSLCLIFIGINLFGVREVGRVQKILVFIILTSLAVYSLLGFQDIHIRNYIPFTTHGLRAVFSTAGFVFISYGGLLKIASIAEEIKNPGRVIPRAMFISFFVVMFFYLMTVFVTTGVLEKTLFNKSLTPISDGASVFMGIGGAVAMSVIAIMAFSSAANAGIMSSSRYPMALGRDGMLPSFFGKINKRFNTPHMSILVTGFFILLTLFLNIELLVKAASSVVILTYMLSCVSVFVLRESRLQNYQPSFRSMLYPWIQIIGIIGYGFLLFEIGREAFLVTLLFILCGSIIYMFYGRQKRKQEFALMHLIERITAKELTGHSLETELKEVIRERDEIVKDRFDKTIENSHILDVSSTMTKEELFKLAADELSKRLYMPSADIYNLLINREKESSTVLTKGMAIPHVVINGENSFEIVIARSKEGFVFTSNDSDVHAVFFLIGTRDERNFHLRALSAIAQIIQDNDFERNWLNAKNQEALRDIILLGKRRRQL